MKVVKLGMILACATLATMASAQQRKDVDPFKRDDRTSQQRQQDRAEAEVRQAYERQQADRQREQMRDKSHDMRLRIDPNTSVGADPSKGQVDVKRTY